MEEAIRRGRVPCALVALLVLPVPVARAQTLVRSVRLGNNVEAVTYVNSGPLADTVVLVDGHQLRGVKVPGAGDEDDDVRVLLDLKTLPINQGMRGLAYVSAEGVFLAQELTQPGTWFVLDGKARFGGATRTVTHLPELSPNGGGEGLSYVPASAPCFADRMISLVYVNGCTRAEVLTRDGVAESEIVPIGDLTDLEACNISQISYRGPDFLVSTFDGFLWTMDCNLVTTSGPFGNGTPDNPYFDLEGVVATAGGMIAVAPYPDGKVMFLDAGFNHLTALDRDFGVGFGIDPFGVAWDPDLDGGSVVVARFGFGPTQLFSLPLSLNRAAPLTDLVGPLPGGISYLPGEKRLAVVSRNFPRAIHLYDNAGVLTEEIAAPAVPGALQVAPYIPTRNQFKARFGTSSVLRTLDRNGALLGSVDLASLGLTVPRAVAYVPEAGGPGKLAVIAFVNGMNQLVTLDLDATAIASILPLRDLHLVGAIAINYIASGPKAGWLLAVDRDNSELAIIKP